MKDHGIKASFERNIKALQLRPAVCRGTAVTTEGEWTLYRIADATPRPSLVPGWKKVTPSEALRGVLDPSFPQGETVLLEPIPTYLHLEMPGLDEVTFVTRFYAESGCGMLLDVSHAWLSAHYLGVSAREFVAAQPLDRVVEIHVAGVESDPDLGGPWIGTAVPDRELLDLTLYAAERAPGLRAVTFDAFSTALDAGTLCAGVAAIREHLALPA